LYKWLAELQLHYTHEYEVQITWVATFLILAAPLYLVAEVTRRVIAAKRSAEIPSNDAAQSGAASPSPRFRLNSGWLSGAIVSLVGLGFVVVGGYQYHQAMTAGDIVHLDAAAYESPQTPGAVYVSVTGVSLRDASAGLKSSDSATKYYMPLVSADWNLNKPVGLFLETDSPNMMESNAMARKMPGGDVLPEIWEGMIDSSGLPGLVRTEFENGHLPLAANYRVLTVGQTPQSQMSNSRTMMIIGGSVAALGVVVGAFGAFKQRRAAARALAAPQAAPLDPRLTPKNVINFPNNQPPPQV
jgi:hypothetical protein